MDICELAKQKMQNLDQQAGRREKTVKAKAGKNKIRILPGWRGNGDPTFYHDFGQHFIKGMTANENGSYIKAVYICTEKTFGAERPCPVCAAVDEGIRNATDDEVLNKLKEAKAGYSVLVNALVLDGDDPSTPVIYELRPSVFRGILDLFAEYGDITALKGGVDIVINKEGRGLNTKYTVMPAAKSADVPESIMEKLHNLDEYVQQEYSEGETRALSSVREVSGALPAPAAGTAMATAGAASAATDGTDEQYGGGGLGTVIDAEPEPAPSAPAESAEPAAQESPAVSDDELDDLLADLG